MNKFNYIENYATGLKKTLAAYAPYDKKPKYESTDHFFVVTLPNVNYDVDVSINVGVNDGVNVGENVGVNVETNLSATQLKVLEHLRNNKASSAVEIAQSIGKSQRTVERAIAELKEKGYIERVGSDKSGSWKVLR